MTAKIALPVALALCASLALSVHAQEPAAQPSAPEVAQPSHDAKAQEEMPGSPALGRVGAPQAGKGQVVFYRPGSMIGMALTFSIHEGEKGICKIGSGAYCVVPMDRGLHTFSVQSEVTDTLNLEIENGETYYVEHTIGVGIVAGRPRIRPSDMASFESKKLKLSNKTPSDLKPKSD